MRSTSRCVLVALAIGLTACGGGSSSPTATSASTSSTAAAASEQPAIWPAASIYFSSPDAAAKDFVEKVLRVPAVLGAFRSGDSRSGEIQVFSPGGGPSPTRIERGLLLLRRLGARNGWFVLSAVNDKATISEPSQAAKVSAGALAVSGKARGFEANVVVSARIAGRAEPVLATVATLGGSYETPEPYSVILDISGASAGDTLMLLVRGGTGMENDPGDFAAIAVSVA